MNTNTDKIALDLGTALAGRQAGRGDASQKPYPDSFLRDKPQGLPTSSLEQGPFAGPIALTILGSWGAKDLEHLILRLDLGKKGQK